MVKNTGEKGENFLTVMGIYAKNIINVKNIVRPIGQVNIFG